MTWPRSILWVSLAGAGTLLVILILYFVRIELTRREVLACRAELEARGEVLHTRELAALTPAKSNKTGEQLVSAAQEFREQDAKKPYLPFGVGMVKSKPGTAEICHLQETARKRPNEDVPWTALEEILKEYRVPLDHLTQALALEYPEIYTDYTRGYLQTAPYITGFLQAGQLLGAESILKLREGKTHEAVEKIELLLALAEAVGKQQTLIDQLLSSALIAIASHSTWDLLHAPSSSEDLQTLQHAWQQLRPQENLLPALRMELSWTAEAFGGGDPYLLTRQPKSLSKHPSLLERLTLIKNDLQDNAVRYIDELTALQTFKMLIDFSQAPAWAPKLADMQSALDATVEFPVSEGIFRSSRDVLQKVALTDTLQKLTLTAIAIRRYQLDQAGAIPETLQELAPVYLAAVPKDIMDGAPLRYQRRKDHYLLYGLGFDGIDDGGNAEPPGRKKFRSYLDGRDIVWPRAVEGAAE